MKFLEKFRLLKQQETGSFDLQTSIKTLRLMISTSAVFPLMISTSAVFRRIKVETEKKNLGRKNLAISQFFVSFYF